MYCWRINPSLPSYQFINYLKYLSDKPESGKQHSELLETRPSVFQSVFHCTTKTMPVFAHWTVILQASHARVAEPPPPPGNPHSARLRGQCPLPRSPQGPTEPYSDSWSILVPTARTPTAQPICSSWSVDSGPTLTVAWLVVFLTAPYSRTKGESWKVPVSHCPRLLFTRPSFQSPSLAWTENWVSGDEQLPYWVSRDEMTQTPQVLPALPLHTMDSQDPSLGNLKFSGIFHSPRACPVPLPGHRVLSEHIPVHTQCVEQSTLRFTARTSCSQTHITFKLYLLLRQQEAIDYNNMKGHWEGLEAGRREWKWCHYNPKNHVKKLKQAV